MVVRSAGASDATHLPDEPRVLGVVDQLLVSLLEGFVGVVGEHAASVRS